MKISRIVLPSGGGVGYTESVKKTFQLKVSGKDDQRVVEAIKNEVRKYVKRERRKTLPEGFSVWDFNCKVGADSASAESKLLDEVTAAIDAVAQSGGAMVYVEILAAAGHRKLIQTRAEKI